MDSLIAVEAETLELAGYKVECISIVNSKWVPDECTLYFPSSWSEHDFTLLRILADGKAEAAICLRRTLFGTLLGLVDKTTSGEVFSRDPQAFLPSLNPHNTSVRVMVNHETPDGLRIESISAEMGMTMILEREVRSLSSR
jgi:hypothetical protein